MKETKTLWDKDVMANKEDLDFLLGENHKYTWDDFYQTLEMEKESGSQNCPVASYIALELLKPHLLKLPWQGARTNSESYQDLFQKAYVAIAEHINEFDRSQSGFKTFIMNWLKGVAREIRSDGLSNYQQNQLGFRIFSTDAMVAKNSLDGEGEMTIDFVDENASVEKIISEKHESRSSALLHQMIAPECTDIDNAEADEKRKAYVTAACYHMFLGGISNFSEDMKDELEYLIEND